MRFAISLGTGSVSWKHSEVINQCHHYFLHSSLCIWYWTLLKNRIFYGSSLIFENELKDIERIPCLSKHVSPLFFFETYPIIFMALYGIWTELKAPTYKTSVSVLWASPPPVFWVPSQLYTWTFAEYGVNIFYHIIIIHFSHYNTIKKTLHNCHPRCFFLKVIKSVLTV